MARAHDHEFFERKLASFVPDRVFDAHAHVWADRNMKPGRVIAGLPADCDVDTFLRLLDELHPGRTVAANVFHRICPAEHLRGANGWVADQVAGDDRFRGRYIAKPQDDADWLRQEVRRLGLHGLKCYHTYAAVERTWEAQFPDYLPESHVAAADAEGWVIMLHMVRSRACADPDNIKWIDRYCRTYPNMKLILAHSARGFQPAHNLEGLPHLTGLDNLYFDTSANCDPLTHEAIIRIIGDVRQ